MLLWFFLTFYLSYVTSIYVMYLIVPDQEVAVGVELNAVVHGGCLYFM